MWKDRVLELRANGSSWTQITNYMMGHFPELTEHQARERARGIIRRDSSYTGKKTEKKAEKVKPVEILENKELNIIKDKWDGNKIIRFGLMGDPQLGSKYTQITHLHKYYDICEKEGITKVYNTGDIFDGIKMRPGHEYELYTISADDQLEDGVKNYPIRKGITTEMISGNHDASLYKLAGYDIVNALAQQREDIKYLGRDCALIHLTPDCTLELRHPWDGTAYALSYKMQKMIEAMESDSKPNILAVGHYHKTEQLFHRNVHAFQTSSFQSQTPFTRGKGISISMGGWILELEVNKKGTIERLKSEFIPFYKAIADDYKNWR